MPRAASARTRRMLARPVRRVLMESAMLCTLRSSSIVPRRAAVVTLARWSGCPKKVTWMGTKGEKGQQGG